MMYRQGDLLFVATFERVRGTKRDSLAILESSVTGHTHRLTAGQVYVTEPSWQDRASFYLDVPDGGAEVVHEEHKPIPLPAGVYRVIRQREVNGYVQD